MILIRGFHKSHLKLLKKNKCKYVAFIISGSATGEWDPDLGEILNGYRIIASGEWEK